jgi:hypothetical protein
METTSPPASSPSEITLEDVLDDERGREALKNFMTKASLPEFLTFLEMTEEFSVLKSDQNRYKKAKDIIGTFIDEHISSVIVISPETRARLLQAFEQASTSSCDNNMFEECCTEVMSHLKDVVWSKFLNSEEGRQYMAQVNAADNNVESHAQE